MYLYQTTRQKQERKVKVILALCLAALLAFIVDSSKMRTEFQKRFIKIFGREMVNYCIPLLEYADSPATERSVQDYILGYFFPILGQGKEIIYYQTEIESDFSYEMILAMEASDENYIDATTGQVVGDTSIAELESDDGLLELIDLKETENTSGSENLQEEVPVIQNDMAGVGKLQKSVTYSREKLADFDYLIQNF